MSRLETTVLVRDFRKHDLHDVLEIATLSRARSSDHPTTTLEICITTNRKIEKRFLP